MLQEVFGGPLDRRSAARLSISFSDVAQKSLAAARARPSPDCLAVQHRRPDLLGLALRPLGRKPTYSIFFLLGAALYCRGLVRAQPGMLALFVAIFCVILTMYGGGFATIPAYLADLFGTQSSARSMDAC